MNSTTDKSPAASCDYCGRENPDGLSSCPGCGTLLVEMPPPEDAGPKPKSKFLAVCLAIIFGPLGLFYVGKWESAGIMILARMPFIVTRRGGLWLTLGSRALCAVWAYHAVVEQDDAPNVRRDSARLLVQAARLENVDRLKAIEAYEEIIRLYPNAPTSTEAARNIEILKTAALKLPADS